MHFRDNRTILKINWGLEDITSYLLGKNDIMLMQENTLIFYK